MNLNRSTMTNDLHKQVTWGDNIVADGWAGAANPHPHLTQHPFQHRHTHKKLLKRSFSHFSTRAYGQTDRRTDGRTDEPTDGQSLLLSCVTVTNKKDLF